MYGFKKDESKPVLVAEYLTQKIGPIADYLTAKTLALVVNFALMRSMMFGLLLFAIYGCSQSQYSAQQHTVDDFLKALQSGDTIKVKEMLTTKVYNGIDPPLFKYYISEASELLNRYRWPERRNYKIVGTEKDAIMEFYVPIFNEEKQIVASIHIWLLKNLPPTEVYTFVVERQIFDKRMIEEPKQMQQ